MKVFARAFFAASATMTIIVVADVLFGDNVMPARPAQTYPADTVLVIVAYMLCATIAAGILAFREPHP